MTSQCCDHDRLCSDAVELQEMASDPTLASCCQRDAMEQAAALKLRAALTLVDPSRHREALRQSVIVRDPGHLQRQETDNVHDDRDSLATSSDEDNATYSKFARATVVCAWFTTCIR